MTIGDIYGLLRRFGLSADNPGFFHISYAVYLAFQQPARCLLAERWLYPVVAQQYETDCLCVERDICSVIDTLWARDPRLLKRLSRSPLPQKPAPAEFVAILASLFCSGGTAA